MIEFQKEYLQIIQQQKQKALIMQSVFGDYLQPFNDIASFVDGDFVGDTPDATASNMDNAINNVTGKLSYMKPMTDYVKEKGKSLTKAFVSPIQMCKTGGNVSQKAQQNGQNAGKYAQRQSYKAVEEECKRKNIRIKGITSESIIAESAPFINKCAKEHSREVSEFLRHCILEDAKQGITPNMWFDSNANPADQRDIIFENTTISFKTNNGKLICEEIQNKSKKRHLISESTINKNIIIENIIKQQQNYFGTLNAFKCLKDLNPQQIQNCVNDISDNDWNKMLINAGLSTDNVPRNAHGLEILMTRAQNKSDEDSAKIFNKVMNKSTYFNNVKQQLNNRKYDPGEITDKMRVAAGAKPLNNPTAAQLRKWNEQFSSNKSEIKNNNLIDTSNQHTYERTKDGHYLKDGKRITKKDIPEGAQIKQRGQTNIPPADKVQTVNTTGVQNGLPNGQASKIPFADKGKFSQQKGIWAKIKWILKSIYQLIYKVIGFICQLILGLILFLIGLIPGVKQWIAGKGGAWEFARTLLQDNPVGRGVIHTFSIGAIVLAVYGIGAAIVGLFTDDQKKELEQAKIDQNNLDLSLISDFGV